MQSKNETNKKINKNVDIKFSAHHTLLESTSSGTLKVERFEWGLSRIHNIVYGHICLRDENLSFDDSYSTVNSNNKYIKHTMSVSKGNNKITELRTILQRESQNS